MITDQVRDEIARATERLHGLLDDLVVRGLRTAGGEELRRLDAAREELDRFGAAHLAGRLDDLAASVRAGGAGGALLRVQTSLRLFDSLLTREVAADCLAEAIAEQGAYQAPLQEETP